MASKEDYSFPLVLDQILALLKILLYSSHRQYSTAPAALLVDDDVGQGVASNAQSHKPIHLADLFILIHINNTCACNVSPILLWHTFVLHVNSMTQRLKQGCVQTMSCPRAMAFSFYAPAVMLSFWP